MQAMFQLWRSVLHKGKKGLYVCEFFSKEPTYVDFSANSVNNFSVGSN